MRSYFFGSGLILAILYMLAATLLIKLFGLELTHYWSTVMLAAGVLVASVNVV